MKRTIFKFSTILIVTTTLMSCKNETANSFTAKDTTTVILQTKVDNVRKEVVDKKLLTPEFLKDVEDEMPSCQYYAEIPEKNYPTIARYFTVNKNNTNGNVQTVMAGISMKFNGKEVKLKLSNEGFLKTKNRVFKGEDYKIKVEIKSLNINNGGADLVDGKGTLTVFFKSDSLSFPIKTSEVLHDLEQCISSN